MPQEINDTYIRERFGADLAQKNVAALKSAMQKYGDNHWWESKDPVEVAKYQVFEDVLMTDFSTFHDGVEKLVGRPVYTHEFGLNVEGLRQEAREAIARIDGKTGSLDDKVAAEREMNGIKTLTDYATKTGKPVIGVVASNQYRE
jgi:hypothetical protein